ncbi:MAG: RsmG family class I SAM-dependent methyltransferase [Bdellovibrionota bacterium]
MNKSESGTPKGSEEAVDPAFNSAVSQARYAEWFPELSEEIRAKILLYQSELIKSNRTISLIPGPSVRTADAVHFADAIKASKEVRPLLIDGAPLYDLGSGNGIPGLVFGLLYPEVKVILVDRDQKKLDFCKHIISVLELKNVSVLFAVIEELPAGSILNAISRGFAPLSKAMLVTRKPLKKGARFFHLKGDGWANELAQVPSQLFTVWSPSLISQYRIPDSNADLGLVLTEKIAD